MASDVERLLLLISYARRHPGAKVEEVARAVGLPAAELRRSLVPLLSTVGRPPFSPADLIEIWIDGQDRLHVELDQSLGRPLSFTRAEAVALRAALASLAGSGAGPYAESAREVLARLAGLAGDDGPEQLVIESGSGERARIEERFAVIDRARREHRVVEIDYYTPSRGELTTRRLSPHALVQLLGAWYVAGHDSRSGEDRIFKVERVREARLTDESFAPPEEEAGAARAALDELKRAPKSGTAQVRLFPPLARVIAEEQPPERIRAEPDGTVILGQDFGSVEWLAGWALAFGDSAEVLSPPEARAALAARCRETLRHYR